MNLLEIFEPTPAGYETEKDDNTAVKLRDLRKTKLTLKQLNRLRIMNDIRKLEHEQQTPAACNYPTFWLKKHTYNPTF
jgi:hypothetical protein